MVTPSGEEVGRVDDIIVRLRSVETYPLVTGIVAGSAAGEYSSGANPFSESIQPG